MCWWWIWNDLPLEEQRLILTLKVCTQESRTILGSDLLWSKHRYTLSMNSIITGFPKNTLAVFQQDALKDGLSTLKMKSAIRGPGVLKVCLSAPFWNSIVVFSTTKTPGVLKLCSPLFPWRVFDSITDKLKIEFKYESYPTDIWFQMTFLLCVTSVCVTNKYKTIYLVDGIDSYGQNGLANFGGASKGVFVLFRFK